MNIPEIKVAKSKLEKTILNLIKDFESNTQAKVNRIYLDSTNFIGYKVEIDIGIE